MEYDKELEKKYKENEKYINEFKKWLKKQQLSSKTINAHLNNAELYINDYLNYYDITNMEDGYHMLNGFFGDWFIRKCMWSTAYATKTAAASIKKFYHCMSELGYISKEKYQFVCDEIKENMESWQEEVEDYNNFDDKDMFIW